MKCGRTSRLLLALCSFRGLLCDMRDSLPFELIKQKPIEEIQDSNISLNRSPRHSETDGNSCHQDGLDLKGDLLRRQKALKKLKLSEDHTGMTLEEISKGSQTAHQEEKSGANFHESLDEKTKTADWKQIQNVFFYLRSISQDLKKKYEWERLGLEWKNAHMVPVWLDFLRLENFHEYIVNHLTTKNQEFEIRGTVWIRSLKELSTKEMKNYEKKLKEMILFLFELKPQFNEDLYYIFKSKYIIETFNYLENLNLVPFKVMEILREKISSVEGLIWISEQVHDSHQSMNLPFYNRFEISSILFYGEEEYFENHIIIGYLGKVFKGLKKRDKQLVWLKIMKETFIFRHGMRFAFPGAKYFHVPPFYRLILSIFQHSENHLLRNVINNSEKINVEKVSPKFREDITRLTNILSDPILLIEEQGFFHNANHDIAMGSVHLLNFVYQTFFKNLPEENSPFSNNILFTLKVLQNSGEIKLWYSMFFVVYNFFYGKKFDKTIFEKKMIEDKIDFYKKRMEDVYRKNCEKLKHELKRNPYHHQLFNRNFHYSEERPDKWKKSYMSPESRIFESFPIYNLENF